MPQARKGVAAAMPQIRKGCWSGDETMPKQRLFSLDFSINRFLREF